MFVFGHMAHAHPEPRLRAEGFACQLGRFAHVNTNTQCLATWQTLPPLKIPPRERSRKAVDVFAVAQGRELRRLCCAQLWNEWAPPEKLAFRRALVAPSFGPAGQNQRNVAIE